jgi:hypothetical protein
MAVKVAVSEVVVAENPHPNVPLSGRDILRNGTDNGGTSL